MRKSQVFIFGYYGWKNTGDDAMIYAILQELCASIDRAEFAVLSLVPIVIPPQARGRVRFIKPSPVKVFWEILRSSVFIIGGGTHIFDYGVKRRVAIILCRILLLVLFSKVFGKRVYILGNGLGPLTTVWGKTLAKLICRLADHISVRDRQSYRILERWGFTDKAVLTFDPSVLIEPSPEIYGELAESDKKISGISLSPVFEIYYNNRQKDSRLVAKIARPVNEWLKQNPGCEAWLFVFKGKSKDDDVLVTQLLQEQLQPPERVKLVWYDPDPAKMLARVAQCHAFIGMRYHSCLFAYLNGVPLLIIDYHPKCRALAEEIELPEHAVISLPEILDGQFQERLNNLLDSPKNFCAALPVEIARQRAMEGIKGVKIP